MTPGGINPGGRGVHVDYSLFFKVLFKQHEGIPDMSKGHSITVFIATLLTPLALYIFRTADTNFTFRWSWLFDGPGRLFIVMPCIALAAALAYALSARSLAGRRPAVILPVLSFVAAAGFWSGPQFNMDTSRYFVQAKHLELYGLRHFIDEWGRGIPVWTDAPLMPLLYGLLFRIFGEDVLCIEVFTTTLFALTVTLTYMIGKALWDEETGLHGGLLLLGIPYIFTQVPLMMVDIPTMFFLTLSIYTFITALERGGVPAVSASSAAVFLTLFSKYSTWPALSVLAVILLVYLKRDPVKAALRGGAAALAALAAAAGVVALKHDTILEQFRILTGYQVTVLGGWTETFTSAFLFQTHPFVTLAALYSGCIALKSRDRRYAVASYLLILLLVFQVKLLRYIIPVFPMFTLMASYGLRGIRDVRLRRFTVLCTVLSSLVLAYGLYLPFLKGQSSMNLKEAGTALNGIDAGTVEVFTLPQDGPEVNPAIAVPILDLFTDGRILYDYGMNSAWIGRPPEEEIITSPTRFSWEFRNPAFYEPARGERAVKTAVAVISGRPGQELPEQVRERIKGMRVYRVFDRYGPGLLRYRTIVTVYSAKDGEKQDSGTAAGSP